jgi:hypothetical protein
LRKPFWTKQELAVRQTAEEKDAIWIGRGCGCASDGCLILFFLSLTPLLWLLG